MTKPKNVWGGGHSSTFTNDLNNAVRWLSPAAKQAMYAAAASRLIKRNTWDGCAFNAGAQELNQSVSSSLAAAQVFDMPQKSVSNFIHVWDNLKGTDDECTEQLKDAILKVGLFSPRGARKIRRITVVESTMEVERVIELDNLVANHPILAMDEVVPGFTEAAKILCNV